MVEIDAEKFTRFMQEVKSGSIRGGGVQDRLDEDIVLELSVGSFERGYIQLRLMVDNEEVPYEDDVYYRRMYKYDERYQRIHNEVSDLVESENEVGVDNSHTWESKIPVSPENHPTMPEEFDPDTVIFFEDRIRLRDDVTLEEAMETNRSEEYSDF